MSALTGNPYNHGTPCVDQLILSRDPAIIHLQEIMDLNQSLAATGELIEGNVCYWHDTPPEIFSVFPPTDDMDHVAKRINLSYLAARHVDVLEIGLNGGHSALITLVSNHRLNFTAVDIGMHQYTEAAATYLRNRFGRRFSLMTGDSREILPRLAIDHPNKFFDLIHIDGGHSAALAYADMSNALRISKAGTTIVLDDINAPHISDVAQAISMHGHIRTIMGQDLVPTGLHEIFEVQ
jgi:predicted O-methyltransferase YrrM